MTHSRRTDRSRLAMSRICDPVRARLLVPSAAPPVGSPGLLGRLVAPFPSPGCFVQARDVEVGRGLTELASAALDAYQGGLGSSDPARIAYIHSICLGREWNLRLYGEHDAPKVPDRFCADGWSVARAFRRANEDGLAHLRKGTWPRRPGGNGDGCTGLLWLPHIDGFCFRDERWMPVITRYDPPDELLGSLHAR